MPRSFAPTLLTTLGLLGQLAVAPLPCASAAPSPDPGARSRSGIPAPVRSPGGRDVAFEANRGQTDAQVRFLARGPGYAAFFTTTGAVLRLDGRDARHATVRLRPVGGRRDPDVVGDAELPGVVNYRRDAPAPPLSAPTYGAVRYVDVYPGVDLVYHGGPRGLEYDLVLAAGADPATVALDFDGADDVSLADAGMLVVRTAAGDLRQPPPEVYQEIDGARRAVDARYVVDADRHVRFRLGAYDGSRPLVIDPVLAWSTYLGGSDDEAPDPIYYEPIFGIAVDPAGNTYVTGSTRSVDFPTTAGADRMLGGNQDVFVTKLSPAGAVLYSTYLGGPCDDLARAIAVDAAGNAYVTGRANDEMCAAGAPRGALVAKLSPTGAVLYSLVLGGSLADASIGQAIAVDATGAAWITGMASSSSGDFPTTPGALRTAPCVDVWNTADGFVAKIDPAGGLVYSTYLCGSGHDEPNGIAVDAAGDVYVAGGTTSRDFPTVNAFQAAVTAPYDSGNGFVTKLRADGAALVFSTYLGGSDDDGINALAVDGAGDVYVTGRTVSTDFPTTAGALQAHAGNPFCISHTCNDGFVSKLDRSGSALVWSTYLLGEADDAGMAIAVDTAGNAYVAGETDSHYFPIRDAFQADLHGTFDAFVVKLGADARLVYASYLGGRHSGTSQITGWDGASGIALDATGAAYVAGYTQSDDFPTTPGAFQRSLGGGICDSFGTPCKDGFVAKVSAGGPGVVPPVHLTTAPTTVAPGGSLTVTWTGIPAPTASDGFHLHTLGAPEQDVLDWPVYWATTGAAAGTSALQLPDTLAPGWYELRLLTPDPGNFDQPTVIARSEPIRVGATTTTTLATTTTTLRTSTTTTTTFRATTTTSTASTTTTLPSTCSSGCDDGDPCTIDACVPGGGCVSTPRSGFASVTCTCERADPAACAGQSLPGTIGSARDRACAYVADAAAASDPAVAAKRLKKAISRFEVASRAAVRARKKGLSRDCSDAVRSAVGDAEDRARQLIASLAHPPA